MIVVCHAEDDSSDGSKKNLVVNFWLASVC